MTTAPAWYTLRSKGLLARWFNTLHWPMTAWHLSYVVIGACLAQQLNLALLGWTLLAFFLGMGIAAHCFDLLKGDPLKLELSRAALIVTGLISLTLAGAIGFWQTISGEVSGWLYLFIPIGTVLAIGYGEEWPGLHGGWQFAAWWAGFPLIVSYLVQGLYFTPALIPALVFALASATAQRTLSTRARLLRRKVDEVEVSLWTLREGQRLMDGESKDRGWLLEPLDKTLAWMSISMVALAWGLLIWRVYG